MSKKELIRRLQISCLGLDPIDPLRLLVDDVIEALEQPQRTWVGLTDEEISDLWCKVSNTDFVTADTHVFAQAIEAKLKEKNT
jgi:hypothetical protein